ARLVSRGSRGPTGLGESEQRSHPLPAANTHRDDPVLGPTPPHLGEQVGSDACAGSTERVPDGDGAAVDVEFVVGYPEFALAVVRLAGERLVDLDKVDVGEGHARLGEQLTDGGHRTNAHDVGWYPDHGCLH